MIVMINRENYETYFIDYLDGQLPVEQIDDLIEFLRSNPDLAEELKGLDSVKLIPAEKPNHKWDHLKKTDVDRIPEFDMQCIRFIEDEMGVPEKEQFLNSVNQSVEKKRTLGLFQMTRFTADPNEKYEAKNRLKKKLVPMYTYWVAAAAVWILAIVFWFSTPRSVQLQPEVVVQSRPEPIPLQVEEPKPELIVVKPIFKSIQEPILEKNVDNDVNVAEKEPVRSEEVPAFMASRKAGLIEIPFSPVELAVGTTVTRLNTKDYSLHRNMPQLLADEINSFEPRTKLNQLTDRLLGSIKRMSNDQFDYENDGNGKVTKIEFSSKLLAFSVPIGSGDDE